MYISIAYLIWSILAVWIVVKQTMVQVTQRQTETQNEYKAPTNQKRTKSEPSD